MPARCFWIGRVMPGVSYRRYAPCGPSALRGRISITSSTLLMSPVSTFRRAFGTISYSVMGSTARISSTPDVTPPLQRLTRLPSLSHPLPLVFCAHPILNSGCSVSCIAFCLPRVPSLLESLHLALVVFFLLLVVRVVLCPFQSGSFRSVLLNFRLQCEKLQGTQTNFGMWCLRRRPPADRVQIMEGPQGSLAKPAAGSGPSSEAPVVPFLSV